MKEIKRPPIPLVGSAGPEVVFPLDKLNRFIEKSEKRVAITAKIKPNIKRKAQAKAVSENRTLSNVIENSLIEYINKK